MPESLKVKAYAKINLYLDVLGRRPDGYHNIRSLMQSISLADELTFEPADDMEIETLTGPKIEREKNLIFKAAKALLEETGLKKGAKIGVKKEIPIFAGLGGGSSDAAATLVGLNRFWELDLGQSELAEIAVKIGSDVPFMITGGTALVEGRGEMVIPLSIEPELNLIVIKPELNLSTADIYAGLNLKASPPPLPIDLMIQALKMNDLSALAACLINRLETVAIKENPILARIKEEAASAGALGALMTGSGAAIFALADSMADAKRIASSLKRGGREVFIARAVNRASVFV